tara:strand:+ start:396 stop:761 length:366 start_codon:yes stop_codon:yes gene_type:complete
MTWTKKKKLYGKKKSYSLIRRLKRERKITEEFEVMLNSLTLEEIIGIKLELASNSVNNRLFGLPLWYGMQYIVKDAVFRYAVSATRTKTECMNFLGLNVRSYHEISKTYGVEFDTSRDEDD